MCANIIGDSQIMLICKPLQISFPFLFSSLFKYP